MTLTIDEISKAVEILEKIYRGSNCTIESVSESGLITMTNGTQWVYDRLNHSIRMVVD